jgi:hypothetical protein
VDIIPSIDTLFGYVSDVEFRVEPEEYLNLYHGKVVKLSIPLSYSVGGSTRISFALGGGDPPWASLDADNGILTFITGESTVGVTYQFNVNVDVESHSWVQSKVIKVRSFYCNPSNITRRWIDWNIMNVFQWDKWDYGNEPTVLNTWAEKDPSLFVEWMMFATQVFVISGIIAAGLLSIISMSPPLSIWLIANQIQLIQLLLLIGTYFPPLVLKVITRYNVPFMNMDYNLFLLIPFVNYPAKAFDFEQTDDILDKLGLKSGSTLANNYSLYSLMLIVFFLHLIFTLFCPKLKKDEANNKKKKCYRFWRIHVKRLFWWAIYIRVIMEAHQTMLLSSISEFNYNDASSIQKALSLGISSSNLLGFACITLLIWISLMITAVVSAFWFTVCCSIIFRKYTNIQKCPKRIAWRNGMRYFQVESIHQ